MKTIRYGVHFPALICAVLVFWFAKDIPFHGQIFGLDFYLFGLMGALHATAIVVSLRDWRLARIIMAFFFVLLATAWSAATPFVALWVSSWDATVLDRVAHQRGLSVIPLFLIGSAIGCSGYWLLARLFWFESFRLLGWLRTVALCVAATLSCFGVARLLSTEGDGTILMIMATWWFAFSFGLYWSEARNAQESILVGQESRLSS